MKRFSLCAFLRNTQGVTAIEYALLAALIAIAVLTGMAAVGGSVWNLWDRIEHRVANAISH